MTVKIISLNIWLGGYLIDNAIAFLKMQNADIVLLQEAFNATASGLEPRYHTVQILKEQLGLAYEIFAPNHDQPDENACIGNAIISRFPITSIDGHNRLYNLQHAVVKLSGADIDIFNLHGAWDLDGDNFSPARQEMSTRIVKGIKNKKNVILAGDTNAKPSNKAVVRIGEYLKSVFGNDLKTTFNMKHKDNNGYASAAVDMMFISPTMSIIEHSCPDVNISDHLPLVVTLEID